jgi:hypothetical protein
MEEREMDKTYKLYWTRSDGQGDILMGEYRTRALAERAIMDGIAVLTAECADDTQKSEIAAGTWDIVEQQRA